MPGEADGDAMMPGLYIKLAIGIAGALALGAIWWHGYHYAEQSINARHQEAYAQQIVKGASDMYAAAQATADMEREHQLKLDALTEQITNVHTETVVKYVQGPSKKCAVSVELERAHDAVSGLLDERHVATNPVPTSADSPGIVAEPPQAALTDVAILAAYEHAVNELALLWQDYSALVEWVRRTYTVQFEASGRDSKEDR